ncbi:MAG: hypothetical protein JRI97_01520 [Deltaproteobacteria bacterium]|nr:hypothetical protein [Deltaproteobacteria bacterium]
MDILCFPHTYLPSFQVRAMALLLGPVNLVSPAGLPDPGLAALAGEGLAGTVSLPEGFSDPRKLQEVLAQNRSWAAARQAPQAGGPLPDDRPFFAGTPSEIRDQVRRGADAPPPDEEARNLAAQVFLQVAEDLDRQYWETWESMLRVREKESRLAENISGPGGKPAARPEEGLFENVPDYLPAHRMDQRMNAFFHLFAALENPPEILSAACAGVTDHLSEHAAEPVVLLRVSLDAGFMEAGDADAFRKGMEELLPQAASGGVAPEEAAAKAAGLAQDFLAEGRDLDLDILLYPLGARALLSGGKDGGEGGKTVVCRVSLSPAAAWSLRAG